MLHNLDLSVLVSSVFQDFFDRHEVLCPHDFG
jgi:hypothetical protein